MNYNYRNLSLSVLVGLVIYFVVFSIPVYARPVQEPPILTNPTRVGNPALAQFPKNDYLDVFARSVWDMHRYNGKIYIGAGDFLYNRGPIDVWSLDTNGNFENEYTVDEEQVHGFRDYDGKLYIPGTDATQSWEYGNLYMNDHGLWQKLRTIPRGIHVWNVAVFKGDIYVQARDARGGEKLMKSSDKGQTWDALIYTAAGSDRRFGSMIPFDDFLLVMGKTAEGRPCVYKYADGNMKMEIFPCPSAIMPSMDSPLKRFVRYRDGVLCAPFSPENLVGCKFPFFFLTSSMKGKTNIKIIKQFRMQNVVDILVRDDICYILVAPLVLLSPSMPYSELPDVKGYIYSSSDLKNWTKLAEFVVPNRLYSFELLQGAFYVGLGFGQGENSESGSIYRIYPSIALPAPEHISGQNEEPSLVTLYQNYPNPFNPDTWIPYALSRDGDVSIKIYTATGQLVRVLNLGTRKAGAYIEKADAVHWNGTNEAGEQVASGTYFYFIEAEGFTDMRKLLIAK